MCKHQIGIRRVKNPYNITGAFIPCGWCDECRRRQKTEWTSRLYGELDYYHTQRKWNVGFITLTYDEACLPHIPKAFFADGAYEKIPCFSYEDIRSFTTCIRSYLYRERGLRNAFRFLITSEYGEQYHRPHYHGILLFHPAVSQQEMWDVCEDAWSATEHRIPNTSLRKRRVNRGMINSFADFCPRDTFACGAYAAKYVCKDIEFTNETNGKFDHLSRSMKNKLRHFMPFHKQSLGFGACMLEGKSDEEIVAMYNDGVQFTANSRLVELPMYLKKKILFTTQKLYNLRTHRFETVKKYTKWFYENKDVVYEKKLRQNEVLLRQYATQEYWQLHPVLDMDGESTGLERKCYFECKSIIQNVGLDELVGFYTCYYGVPLKNCHVYEDMADAIFSRYNPGADNSDLPRLSADYYNSMSACITYILGCAHLCSTEQRSKADELYDRIRAFFSTRGRTALGIGG